MLAEGEEQIYVVASAQAMRKLEELYGQYNKADSRSKDRRLFRICSRDLMEN